MNIIEEIKRRINIVDLATELGLNPTKNYFIFSIYKEEKRRSLKLYPDTNSFYCYATGRGGDVIDFYKDYYQIDFKDAVKELEMKAGLNTNTGKYVQRKCMRKNKNRNEQRMLVLKSEKEFYEERAGIGEYMMGLERNKAENNAVEALMNDRREIQILIYESLEKFCFSVDDESFEYLLGKDRGLKPDTIKKFRLFSVENHSKVLEYLKDCFTSDDLIISGLINKKGNFVFTYHKLIIPYLEDHKITYLRGRCINTKTNYSKYTGLCNFSGNLSPKRFYNINVLKNVSTSDKLLICEGEFDTMIMEQEGHYACGISGVSNIPEDQIHLVKDFNVYLAFDNDKSGVNATHRIAKLFNKPIKAIRLKHYKDLTEYVNERS